MPSRTTPTDPPQPERSKTVTIQELIDRVASPLPEDWKYRAAEVFYARPADEARSPVYLSGHRYPSVAADAAQVVQGAGLTPVVLGWKDMHD
jgi:hypothetical protein